MPEPLPATALQPRVYLQIVDQADRDHAKSMGAVLQQAKFMVVGIEYVKKARLRNTEVRYYKKADGAEADKIDTALRQAGDSSLTILYLGLDNNTKVRPRHYEVWFRAQTPQTRFRVQRKGRRSIALWLDALHRCAQRLIHSFRRRSSRPSPMSKPPNKSLSVTVLMVAWQPSVR